MALSKEQLLALRRPAVHEVHIEGVGEVRIRALGMREILSIEADVRKAQNDKFETLAIEIAAYLANESGERLFSIEEARDFVEANAIATTKIIKAAEIFNGLSEPGKKDIEKNS
jgi:hypothetical protein